MSNQVVKIELKGAKFLELLQVALKDQLPADASVEAVYHNPHSDVVGVLVASKDYPVVEGGDLVFYAKALDLVSAKELKTVIEQVQPNVSISESGTVTIRQDQAPVSDGKTGK